MGVVSLEKGRFEVIFTLQMLYRLDSNIFTNKQCVEDLLIDSNVEFALISINGKCLYSIFSTMYSILMFV